MHRAPAPVEATLFYTEAQSLPFTSLLGTLNGAFSERGTQLLHAVEKSETSVLFRAEGFHLTAELGSKALDPAPFMSALKAPITQLNPADFRRPVFGHSAFIRFSVRFGEPETVAADTLYEIKDHSEETTAQFEQRLDIAWFLLRWLVDRARPMAVHWSLSDKLMTGEEVRALKHDPFPLPLYITPSLFSSGNVVEGVRVVGFQALGTEHLIGHRVVFQEAPLPYTHLLQRTYEFVEYCRSRGEVIPDGDSYGISEADVIRVHHGSETTTSPLGTVELTYERVGTEALSQELANTHALIRLGEFRRSFSTGSRAGLTWLTYGLCGLSTAVSPLLGVPLLLFNILWGPKPRTTVLVTAALILLSLSGLGLSTLMADLPELLATASEQGTDAPELLAN